MNQKMILSGVLVFLVSCVSPQHSMTPAKRKTSSTDDPQHPSLATVLFSWTDNPAAQKDPQQFVASKFKFTQECNTKFAKTDGEVQGCEGNGLYAGPGLYTCDNPFTSQDYGSTVVIVQTLAGKNDFFDFVQLSHGAAAEGPDRETYADPKVSAILYDFRASSYNTKALVVRNASILDPRAYAVTIGANGFARFKDHSAYACTAQTSITDILAHWGDQMNFMARIFFPEVDPAGQGFVDGNKLNATGLLAAVASDAVALPPDQLQRQIIALTAKYREFKESLNTSSCQETATLSPRACLADRIFNSALGNMGNDAHPTYAWSLKTTLGVLVDLGILDKAETAKISSSKNLVAALAAKTQNNAQAMQRITEATQCVSLVRASLNKNHLGMWSAN